MPDRGKLCGGCLTHKGGGGASGAFSGWVRRPSPHPSLPDSGGTLRWSKNWCGHSGSSFRSAFLDHGRWKHCWTQLSGPGRETLGGSIPRSLALGPDFRRGLRSRVATGPKTGSPPWRSSDAMLALGSPTAPRWSGSPWMSPGSCPPECRQRMGLFLDPRGAECGSPRTARLPAVCTPRVVLMKRWGHLPEFRWSNRLTSFCFCG